MLRRRPSMQRALTDFRQPRNFASKTSRRVLTMMVRKHRRNFIYAHWQFVFIFSHEPYIIREQKNVCDSLANTRSRRVPVGVIFTLAHARLELTGQRCSQIHIYLHSLPALFTPRAFCLSRSAKFLLPTCDTQRSSKRFLLIPVAKRIYD